MRKIILDLATTLDGFIEGPNGEVDWCILDDDMDFQGFLEGIDTILYGRVSYDMWGNYHPDTNASESEKEIWAAVHAKQKIVFSSQERPNTDVTFIASSIPDAIAELKQQQGKDIWLYGGAKLITAFIQHGLIDVYRISVHPTVLGAGKPLFQDLEDRINLDLIAVNRFRAGVVQLVYKPKG
ncbi:dihydrofolate reductase family protein [Pontibacter sp. BAB1700]|uniref:dihydrofolate reductase family protein n=1 Tax=Pontibacter sp. BAB1700 TaxID=1144253 RepID=UPI00026BC974|nr:dihydrofolate reductase family protein [Pontibacter sp. BAB1700]EJF10645.1 bifunctional deaminase-reductase domain-containing protein [Pontibacter sp. BAB1700]